MVSHTTNLHRGVHKTGIFPNTDAIVITTHIDKWDVTRVLIDNSSQTEILFFSDFDQMGFDRK
jgi:hypothetical protein